MRNWGIAGLVLMIASPCWAQDKERDYCPERPGLDTPACTMAPGRISVETAIADWTHTSDPSQRNDTVLIGDTLVRVGLGNAIEAQIGWTPFGHDRTRDKATGMVDTIDRTGDALVGLKLNLRNPDGKDFSAAIKSYVTVPVGRSPIGAGDWGAALLVPVTYELSKAVTFEFTPEADAAVDSDGHGRHFAASATAGFGVALSQAVNATAELQALRDDDPDGKTTQALAALSLAWMPTKSLQFDVGGAAGLNRAAPDAELYVGIARRF